MKMIPRVALSVILTMTLVLAAQAAEPEPTTDFYVPPGTNMSAVTADYFTTLVFREPPAIVDPKLRAVTSLTSLVFPVLTGLAICHSLANFPPGGVNPPHSHPRGTEVTLASLLHSSLHTGLFSREGTEDGGTMLTFSLCPLQTFFVTEGVITVGLVDTNNKLYLKELKKGDLFVFPKGLVHFQINLSKKNAIAFVSFSSSSPGTQSLPLTLFGSGIPDIVHTTAFKVDNQVVDKLQAAMGK